MERLNPSEVITLLLGLGTLLASARILGELAQRLKQPAVLGEMMAGILLGPTVLGAIAPQIPEFLFPAKGNAAIALDGFTTLAIALFLLVAGIEVDLSVMWRQGKVAGLVGLSGTIFPFALGYAATFALPTLLGHNGQSDRHLYALFIATALSISALPVVAKVLMDMGLYRSDLGMVVVGAAVLNDLIGAVIFAVILSLMASDAHGAHFGITATIVLTLAFAGFVLTVGRIAIHRVMPFLQAHTSWPGGVLAFSLSVALFCAAFTEWVGVHAIFGAFLAGVAIGDSSHLREHTRAIINDFVSFIFAPVFFATIGLRINFVTMFDPMLVGVVLLIACVGKIFVCGYTAKWAGLPARESWAIGFGMNARGAMEIIFSLLALDYGLIDERMFVALVIMALVTSMMSGPAISSVLRLKKPHRIADALGSKAFVSPLAASNVTQAIETLSQAACAGTGLEADSVVQAVLARESLMSTGMGHGLAIPHARIGGLTKPLLAVGISRAGVDFNAPDGEPAKLIFLILTPLQDNNAQIQILADIARIFKDADIRQAAVNTSSFTEFRALLRTQQK